MVAAGMTPMQVIMAATKTRPSSSRCPTPARSKSARTPTLSCSMRTRSTHHQHAQDLPGDPARRGCRPLEAADLKPRGVRSQADLTPTTRARARVVSFPGL